jgi:uncharacterized damage-inducible protein DinB
MMLAQQVQAMASYNRWMNDKLYAACGELSDEERKADRKAFFKSIHGTLNHLLLADRVWFGRFVGRPFRVKSLDQELYTDFADLRAERGALDQDIEGWAQTVTDEQLAGTLRYVSVVSPAPLEYALWVCVAHFFNHQTHHRGQVTTLLTQCGKDYGVTDLIRMPELGPRS